MPAHRNAVEIADAVSDLFQQDFDPAAYALAHGRNAETLERIYIGRRFRNDTERLEKLFDMYTKMTAAAAAPPAAKRQSKAKCRDTS